MNIKYPKSNISGKCCLFPAHRPRVSLHKKDMSILLNTAFDSLYLSSHLPDEVEIQSLTPNVTVKISVASKEVFSSDYYTYYQKVYVRDIRSIVESAMLQMNLAIAKFVLTAVNMENMESSSGDVTVVYSQMKSSEDSEAFLLNNFLSTRKSALISRSCPFSLHFYTDSYQQVSNYCIIYYKADYSPDKVLSYRSNFGSKLSDTTTIKSVSASYYRFQSILATQNITNVTIISVHYQIGSRAFDIYFTSDEPSDIYQFNNAFNLQETVCLFAASTSKTDISRSEAVQGRVTSFYDVNTRVKHEVETAPLTFYEAKHLTQLITSQNISRCVAGDEFAPVIVADSTPEVTDDITSPVRMKFTYEYSDQTDWL